MLPRIVFPIAQSFHSVVRPLRVAHSMLANAGELAVRGLWAGAVQPQGESLRVQSLHTPPCCTHRPPPKDDLPWMRNPPTHTPLATLAHSSVHTAARASHRPTDLVRAVASLTSKDRRGPNPEPVRRLSRGRRIQDPLGTFHLFARVRVRACFCWWARLCACALQNSHERYVFGDSHWWRVCWRVAPAPILLHPDRGVLFSGPRRRVLLRGGDRPQVAGPTAPALAERDERRLPAHYAERQVCGPAVQLLGRSVARLSLAYAEVAL